MSVPITDFRQNIFRFGRLIEKEGYEIEVENEGRKVFKVSKIEETPQTRARRARKILKKLGGAFPDFTWDREFFRGKKELKYMKKLGKW